MCHKNRIRQLETECSLLRDAYEQARRERDALRRLLAGDEASHEERSAQAAALDAHIATHATRLGFHIADVAAHFEISTSHAANLLRTHLGTTFTQRRRHYQLLAAKRLLRGSKRRLKEIAAVCGFRNHARLCEAFRQAEGCTPTEYRRGGAYRNVDEVNRRGTEVAVPPVHRAGGRRPA